MTPRCVTIGSAQLWLGDCRDVLEMIPGVDAVVSDPPDGIDYTHSGNHACRFSGVGRT